MFDFKKLRARIIRKIILAALIGITGIVIAILGNYAAVPAAQIGAEAGMGVMSGDQTTVTGMATQNAVGSALAVGRIIAWVFMAILWIVFVTDIGIDVYKYFSDKEKEKDQ